MQLSILFFIDGNAIIIQTSTDTRKGKILMPGITSSNIQKTE